MVDADGVVIWLGSARTVRFSKSDAARNVR